MVEISIEKLVQAFETTLLSMLGEKRPHKEAAKPIALRPGELLNDHQLAAELNISRRTLQNWRPAKKGPPYVRFGGAIRYRRSDVDRWLARNSVAP